MDRDLMEEFCKTAFPGSKVMFLASNAEGEFTLRKFGVKNTTDVLGMLETALLVERTTCIDNVRKTIRSAEG
jgi:hypothetical protein